MFLVTAYLLALTLARAEPIEAQNYWKKTCRQISAEFRDRLPVPYHQYANVEAIKCTDPTYFHVWPVKKDNIHVVVVNLFYHEKIPVRARALEMLERYDCSKENTCKLLVQMIDDHIKSAGMKQPDEWTRKFFDRVRAVQLKAKSRL
jgi:hypothetical protein